MKYHKWINVITNRSLSKNENFIVGGINERTTITIIYDERTFLFQKHEKVDNNYFNNLLWYNLFVRITKIHL